MLLSKLFSQEQIANGARKRNVDGSSSMDVAYFRCLEAKLFASKSVKGESIRPATRQLSFKSLEIFHFRTLFNASFDACA